MHPNQSSTWIKYITGLILIATVLIGGAGRSIPANAAGNPIEVENQQPGTANWRLTLNEATDTGGQIKGYASATSVNKGDSLTFYVTVNPAQTYSMDVYRMGYYQGLGGRLM